MTEETTKRKNHRRARKGDGNMYTNAAGTWCVSLKIGKTRKSRVITDKDGNTFKDRTKAVKFRDKTIAEIREQLTVDRSDDIAANEFENCYLKRLTTETKRKGAPHVTATKETGLRSEASHTFNLNALRQFVAFLPNGAMLSDVTATKARDFMATKGTLKNSSYNRYLASLKHIFEVLENDSFSTLPTRAKHLVVQDTHSHERFSDQELDLIDKEARGWIRCAMFISFHTGLRLGDVVTFKTDSIDSQGVALGLTNRKTSKTFDKGFPDLVKHIQEFLPQRILDWNTDRLTNSAWFANQLGLSKASAHKLLGFLDTRDFVDEFHYHECIRKACRKAIANGTGASLATVRAIADGAKKMTLEPIPAKLQDFLFPRQAERYLGIVGPKDVALASKQIKKWLKAIGIDGKTFHSMRSTHASIKAAKDGFFAAQKTLNHSNPETTKTYVQLNETQRRELVLRDDQREALLEALRAMPKGLLEEALKRL